MSRDRLTIGQKDLLAYVDAVNMLVTTVTLDIKKPGRKVSADTILACSKLISAAERLRDFTNALDARRDFKN